MLAVASVNAPFVEVAKQLEMYTQDQLVEFYAELHNQIWSSEKDTWWKMIRHLNELHRETFGINRLSTGGNVQ